MYAEITFNNPVFQRLNEILDHLEINYEINYTDKDGQLQMTSEEAVRKVAAELSDNDDVEVLAGVLGLEVGEYMPELGRPSLSENPVVYPEMSHRNARASAR